MKTVNQILGMGIVMTLLYSCENEKIDKTTAKTPGSFNLTQIATTKSNSLKSAKTNSSNIFDFGDIKASKEYYFLLINGGEEPIFDVTMTFNNSSFTISPEKIDYLPGEDLLDAGNSSIIPMLTLGITHGINLNGVGYTDLLPMGENNSTLEVTGKTLDNGDTIEISGNFDFSVFARVMDIEVYEDEAKINLKSPTGGVSTNLGGLGFMRYYSIFENSSISVKNIGNVKIDLYYGDSNNPSLLISLNESDSTTLALPSFVNALILDSEGTISDYSRIQLGDDGNGYLSIIKDKHE